MAANSYFQKAQRQLQVLSVLAKEVGPVLVEMQTRPALVSVNFAGQFGNVDSIPMFHNKKVRIGRVSPMVYSIYRKANP